MLRHLYTFLAFFIVLILDQGSKYLLLEIVNMPMRSPLEITPFFNLVMVWNRGVSFGMFAGLDAKWFLTLMSLGISALLFYWNRQHESRLQHIATGMIIGGAIGNVIDRFMYGAVADFFDMHVMGYHWPAFNVADMAIVIGVFTLLGYELLHAKNSQKPTAKD